MNTDQPNSCMQTQRHRAAGQTAGGEGDTEGLRVHCTYRADGPSGVIIDVIAAGAEALAQLRLVLVLHYLHALQQRLRNQRTTHHRS